MTDPVRMIVLTLLITGGAALLSAGLEGYLSAPMRTAPRLAFAIAGLMAVCFPNAWVKLACLLASLPLLALVAGSSVQSMFPIIRRGARPG